MSKSLARSSVSITFILLLVTSTQWASAQDLIARSKLAQAFEESTKKVIISDNYDDIPQHKIYRSIFIKALLNSEFGGKFPTEDWEIIYSLPSHNDVQFTEYARDTLMDSCSEIARIDGIDYRSANAAGVEFEKAKSKIMQQLDQHYEVVLESFSEIGKQIVYGEIVKRIETGMVTYSDIDFSSLGSIEPEFTLKYLSETCRNVEFTPGLNHEDTVYLRDELSESYKVESVQEYSSEEINKIN